MDIIHLHFEIEWDIPNPQSYCNISHYFVNQFLWHPKKKCLSYRGSSGKDFKKAELVI